MRAGPFTRRGVYLSGATVCAAAAAAPGPAVEACVSAKMRAASGVKAKSGLERRESARYIIFNDRS